MVHAFKVGREGTKAPWEIYYKYNGRWITPFEQRIKGWKALDLNAILRFTYSALKMEHLIYRNNPLLQMIPKGSSWSGAYLKLPIG